MTVFTVWLKIPAWLAGIYGDDFVCSNKTREHAEARAETALNSFIAQWLKMGGDIGAISDSSVVVIEEISRKEVYSKSVGDLQ